MKTPIRVLGASVVSVVLCLIATVACWQQPDPWAAILIWPHWFWLIPALLLTGLSWHRNAKWFATLTGLGWLAFAGFFIEELHWHPPGLAPAGEKLRVVSLNCAGGNKLAAAEVINLNPDIAFFQESPDAHDIAAVARQLYGRDAGLALGGRKVASAEVIALNPDIRVDHHSPATPEVTAVAHSRNSPHTVLTIGADTMIIARGQVTPVAVENPWNMNFTEARVTLTNGLQVAVICLRLMPYSLRADVWSPDYWDTQAEVRRRQHMLLDRLIKRLDNIPRELPLIVGGDFNLGGNDALLRRLKPRLHDTFLSAGSGLGNTLINEFPFVRIDQIWINDAVYATQVFVQRTENSDHRMVIADFVLPRNR